MPLPSNPIEIATYYVIAVNFLAFALFGIDKARAENGGWRISEGTLLTWAFLGGILGAYAGRSAFRHKTRKQPFCNTLHSIAGLQLLLVGLLFAAFLSGLEDRVNWGEQGEVSFASAYAN